MKINGIEIKAKKFAYDGCHKIYIIEDIEDEKEAISYNYKIYEIKDIEEIYKNSCSLRFIDSWKLNKIYVQQFKNATFSY